MKVLHVGNLANNGYKLAKFQRRLGIDARLRLHPSQVGTGDDPAWEDAELRNGYPSWIELEEIGRFRKLRLAGEAIRRTLVPARDGEDIVHAQCTAPIRQQFLFSSHLVSHCLGSDLREMAVEASLRGRLLRRAYRRSSIVYFNNVDHLECLSRLGIRGEFLPNPLDLDRFRPRPSDVRFDGFDFVVLHPARLDWTYRGTARSSMKGNDRLIRAFARFLRQRPKALLLLLDSGVDRAATADLIRALGIGDNVRFLGRMEKEQFAACLNAADLVADQFDIGSMGGVALEALACGKPLLVHLNNECARACYGEPPPVFNVRTEDEIYDALGLAADSDLGEAGARSRAWMEAHHAWKPVVETVIRRYETIVGR
jgi:glycosyltransferase involved in cell wall biosynthesis